MKNDIRVINSNHRSFRRSIWISKSKNTKYSNILRNYSTIPKKKISLKHSLNELSRFQEFEDQNDFRMINSNSIKGEINGYVRIISIRIVLIVLSFTRGEHVPQKYRDISAQAGVNKVVCNRVRYLRMPHAPLCNVVGATRTGRRWDDDDDREPRSALSIRERRLAPVAAVSTRRRRRRRRRGGSVNVDASRPVVDRHWTTVWRSSVRVLPRRERRRSRHCFGGHPRVHLFGQWYF